MFLLGFLFNLCISRYTKYPLRRDRVWISPQGSILRPVCLVRICQNTPFLQLWSLVQDQGTYIYTNSDHTSSFWRFPFCFDPDFLIGGADPSKALLVFGQNHTILTHVYSKPRESRRELQYIFLTRDRSSPLQSVRWFAPSSLLASSRNWSLSPRRFVSLFLLLYRSIFEYLKVTVGNCWSTHSYAIALLHSHQFTLLLRLGSRRLVSHPSALAFAWPPCWTGKISHSLTSIQRVSNMGTQKNGFHSYTFRGMWLIPALVSVSLTLSTDFLQPDLILFFLGGRCCRLCSWTWYLYASTPFPTIRALFSGPQVFQSIMLILFLCLTSSFATNAKGRFYPISWIWFELSVMSFFLNDSISFQKRVRERVEKPQPQQHQKQIKIDHMWTFDYTCRCLGSQRP